MLNKHPHTDAEAHIFSRQRTALTGRHSLGATWVVEHLVARNKAQSLFAAA